jgi:hypothetical protein
MIMSKFSKKILSAKKEHRNCVVVGNGIGYLDDILESFQTVFIIDGVNINIRKRNIVYRESFDGIESLIDVDFVFLDAVHFSNLKKLRPLWLKCKPVFFMEGNDLFGIENYKYFRTESYALIERYKNMQKWIPQ